MRRIGICLCSAGLALMLAGCATLPAAVRLHNAVQPAAVALEPQAEATPAPTPTPTPTPTPVPELEFESVELVMQNPELPNGCEVTSLSMVLTAAGYPVDKVELYEEFLPAEEFTYSGDYRYGPSPEDAYVGDAASATGGWYCFEQPILTAGNAWIEYCGGGAEMVQLTGLSQDDLDELLADHTPVVAWVTREYGEPYLAWDFSWVVPTGEEYVPYNNLHCVAVAGIYGDEYLVADPLEGWNMVDRDTFWSSFDAMGRRAVTVVATAE